MLFNKCEAGSRQVRPGFVCFFAVALSVNLNKIKHLYSYGWFGIHFSGSFVSFFVDFIKGVRLSYLYKAAHNKNISSILANARESSSPCEPDAYPSGSPELSRLKA